MHQLYESNNKRKRYYHTKTYTIPGVGKLFAVRAALYLKSKFFRPGGEHEGYYNNNDNNNDNISSNNDDTNYDINNYDFIDHNNNNYTNEHQMNMNMQYTYDELGPNYEKSFPASSSATSNISSGNNNTNTNNIITTSNNVLSVGEGCIIFLIMAVWLKIEPQHKNPSRFKHAPKNLENIKIVERPTDSVIYKSYTRQISDIMQSQSRKTKSQKNFTGKIFYGNNEQIVRRNAFSNFSPQQIVSFMPDKYFNISD
ncbi:hypothetical protein HELRODRAFT_163442 [Helobdella robusta]|uniref:Uncharacterized protein n=1 Tax=Helobdella robusta TaxID=6412 RepID=T1EU21_HELRO|nr:hypothetical protein HELRODRAFT_163442 [Helobdella robusta]ESN96384.1 hypothetical protein HELRODRAFT_163442 [Helobdella robusta]